MVNIFNSSKDNENDDEAIKQIHEDLQEIVQELKISNTQTQNLGRRKSESKIKRQK